MNLFISVNITVVYILGTGEWLGPFIPSRLL